MLEEAFSLSKRGRAVAIKFVDLPAHFGNEPIVRDEQCEPGPSGAGVLEPAERVPISVI